MLYVQSAAAHFFVPTLSVIHVIKIRALMKTEQAVRAVVAAGQVFSKPLYRWEITMPPEEHVRRWCYMSGY